MQMLTNSMVQENRHGAPPSVEMIREGLKRRIHKRILTEFDLAQMSSWDEGRLREAVAEAANRILNADDEAAHLPRSQRASIVQEIMDEVLGLGPLQSLLDDPNVSEIMVNGPSEVYVERQGRIERSDKRFRDSAHIMQVVERIIAPLGRRLDESSPMVDSRVPGGYRLNAIIPPLSVTGTVVTIRKFFNDRYGIEGLSENGTITPEVADFLRACVQAKVNMVVSGGTGTGKTTMLNALSAFIPNDERIITIENPAELQLKQEHVISLETRPPSIDGRNAITQRELVVNALRMRPDRIIVGEVRSGEAFDMLQAMNTGHEGSMTTVHANSPRDVLSRVENMVLMAGFDLPVRVIREQISSALHLIVHLNRVQDGSRRVVKVTEICGMEGQVVSTQDIWAFQQAGLDDEGRVIGGLVPTGIRPTFTDRFPMMGVKLDTSVFSGRGY
jgi:pilus assembly protein CpaF